ncbi:MAG: ATP-binding protein [Deltaproteobacteria bacterium]|nr:ATP-binding protein [Deltaproteobacteria bacterium]
MLINRKQEVETLQGLLRRHPVVGLIGARQVGKSTLARILIERTKGPTSYFDLENPEDTARLSDPMIALRGLKGLVVIDEVHRQPNLFPILRVLVDRPQSAVRFLVLGSASPDLLRQSSETLAGRIFYHELGGFSLEEVGIENYNQRWLRGGFPRSYLARNQTESDEWRQGFIRTFLERDLPQFGITIRSATLRRFWAMLANYHGQIWNSSEFARSFGVADTTIRNYLDLMSAALVVRQLLPWYENLSKRQVKAPKIYIADSGLLHTLLGLRTLKDLENHPKVGASWEGFVLEQVIDHLGVSWEDCFFWATHGGAELDLLIVKGQRRIGFEIKRTTSPQITPSMRHALSDLHLQSLDVTHAGDYTFPLDKKIRAVSFRNLLKDIQPLS